MRAQPLIVLAVLLTAAVSLAACGGGDDDRGGPAAGATSTATPTATTTQPEGIDTMPGASTKPVVTAATNEQTALLTAVRAARHEGYDRVVFEFRNAVPGYDVRYIERPVRQDASGDVVEVKGPSVVQIRMQNALDADLTQSSAPRTYTGPTRFSPGTPEIAELVRTGGFENVLTWVAGLQNRADFRVATLQDPPRLVVDFRNH